MVLDKVHHGLFLSEGEAGYRLGRRDWEAGERSVFGGVERVYVWPGGAAEGDVREGGDVWQEVTRVVIFRMLEGGLLLPE